MTALPGDSLTGISVSRETIEALRVFEAEVRRWNSTINLVSRSSLDDVWDRHIADSAQIFHECPPNALRWVDFGSGGGFPGLVIAILAREHRPDLRVALVEADKRKAAFLQQTSQKLDLAVRVEANRIESLPPQRADVVSARALARLSLLLDFAAPHLNPGGIALFPKGIRHAEEILEAQGTWAFDLDCVPSVSESGAAILIVRKLNRAHLS